MASERDGMIMMGAIAMRLGLPAVLLFLCGSAVAQAAGQGRSAVFNILDYGARNDGSTSATEAFRKAIEAAQKAGGGTVYVPAGDYVTGPIQMVSNLTLSFDAGAIVRFPAVALPMTRGRQQGIETLTPIPLIGGHDLENVAVVGRGVLTTNNADWMRLHNRALRSVAEAGSANGESWEHLLKALEALQPVSETEYRAAASELRPSFVRFMNSKNIRIDGLRFIGSSMWTVHLLYSENAVVENLVIQTYPGVHADGIVIDSSRFVKLANDYIDTGDDGLVIKSGKDRDGLRVNRPTEDVAITNCTVQHAQAALAIGSETSGGVRNLVASNITVKNTVNGIHLKSRRGRGGVVEDIRFDNWTMENVGQAISVSDAGYQMEGEAPDPGAGPVTQRTPSFRNIAISHMTINGAQGLIDVSGIPEMPTTGIRISDVVGKGRRGLTGSYTDDLELHNVQLDVDAGPAFQMTHSANLELDHVGARRPLRDTPVIRLEQTPGAVVRNSRAFPGTAIFLSMPEGEQNEVTLQGNLLTDATKPMTTGASASWPSAIPRTKESCLVRFDLDEAHPTMLNDEAKICLNLIAAQLKRSSGMGLALIGNTGNAGERGVKTSGANAAQRARNSRDYLVKEKGIQPARIKVYRGEPILDGPEDIDRIEAQMVAGTVVEGNVETVLLPAGASMKYRGLSPIR
jgi:polygalacturonase